jgi:hypothetical protein
MKLLSLGSFLSILIFVGCSGSEIAEEQIVYSELPELQVDLVTEAGESGDYFPSRLNELVVTQNGSIIVSDFGSTTLEQFSPDGTHLQTIASEGGGPGELPNFFYLKNAGDGRLIVEHPRSRLDYFEPGQEGTYTYSSTYSLGENRGREFRIVGGRSSDDYYALELNIISDVQSLMTNPRDYRDQIMVIVDESMNLIQDSLAVLQTPLPHLTDAGNGGFSVDMVPYRNTDRFIPLQSGGYLTARPGDALLKMFDADLTLLNEIKLNVAPREVGSSDLNYAFRNYRDEIVRDIEPRVHDFKPPFLNILASETHLWLHTDNSENGKEFVVMQMDGTPAGKFMLSEFDDPKSVIGNRIYAIHQNPDLGHSVRVYEVEL